MMICLFYFIFYNISKPPTKYILVEKIKLFGLFLFVYVRQSLYESDLIHDVYKSWVATGIMDTLGNKGSVGVSMRIHETRLCFVCSHFAADTDKLEKRNSDYRATKMRLKFIDEVKQAAAALSGLDEEQYKFDLDDHDAIFWFGDLNYRVDKMSITDSFKHIYANNFDYLIKYDQLSSEREMRRVFEDYQEGKIDFKPTYKFLIKSGAYEKQSLVDAGDPSISQGYLLDFKNPFFNFIHPFFS